VAWKHNYIQRFVSGVPLNSLTETKAPLLELESVIQNIQHEVNSHTEREIS
jgi:hypothetical protein